MAWNDPFADYPASGNLITAAQLNAIISQIHTYFPDSSANSPIRTLFLSGAGGYACTTGANGGFVTTEIPGSDPSLNFKGVKFSAQLQDASNNYDIVMPLNWNGGTVTATPWFFTTNTGTSGTAVFSVAAGGYDNSDNMSTALGTAQSSTYTFNANRSYKLLKGAVTSAITVAGTSTGGEFVKFVVTRTGSDTFAGDLYLVGVVIQYTTDNWQDA